MNFSRILTAPGPDARTYIVRADSAHEGPVCTFVTAGVNGKTPDETALANLADLSEQANVELGLFRVTHGRIGAEYSVLIGYAEHGCTREV